MRQFHEQPGAVVFQSALYQTNATVVVTDELVLVVDPTWLPHEIESIRRHVDQVRGQRPLYVLFTHSDFDHLIGAAAFADGRTIASDDLARYPQPQAKVEEMRRFDASYYIERSYPLQYPAIDEVIERDGQVLQLGGTRLTFYKAQGHTACGLFAVIEPLGIWIAGDYLSDFELPFIEHSATAYEQTLNTAAELLQRHDIRLLVPGHGAPTRDRQEMRGRLQLASEHLRQLKTAVREGDEAALARLEQRHGYPSEGTSQAHALNIEMIRREQEEEAPASED